METQITNQIEKETKSLVIKTEKLLSGFKVNSQPALIKANDYLVQITQAEKQVIEREKAILDPLNQAHKSIIAFFKPFKDKLSSIKWQLKGEMGSYIMEMERKEAKKKKEIEKKVEEGKIDIDKAFEKIQKFEEKKEAVIVRTDKVVKVVDENKLPKQYFVIDMVKVRRDALAGIIGEKQGVKIEEVKSVIGKGR